MDAFNQFVGFVRKDWRYQRVIRSHNPKDRQCNDQKKNDKKTNNNRQNTTQKNRRIKTDQHEPHQTTGTDGKVPASLVTCVLLLNDTNVILYGNRIGHQYTWIIKNIINNPLQSKKKNQTSLYAEIVALI